MENTETIKKKTVHYVGEKEFSTNQEAKRYQCQVKNEKTLIETFGDKAFELIANPEMYIIMLKSFLPVVKRAKKVAEQ
jgi:hypothetical protein